MPKLVASRAVQTRTKNPNSRITCTRGGGQAGGSGRPCALEHSDRHVPTSRSRRKLVAAPRRKGAGTKQLAQAASVHAVGAHVVEGGEQAEVGHIQLVHLPAARGEVRAGRQAWHIFATPWEASPSQKAARGSVRAGHASIRAAAKEHWPVDMHEALQLITTAGSHQVGSRPRSLEESGAVERVGGRVEHARQHAVLQRGRRQQLVRVKGEWSCGPSDIRHANEHTTWETQAGTQK